MKYSQGKFDPSHPLITQSFLNMFADCAYAAVRRYVNGEILPPGVAALQGTATDAAVTLGCHSVIKTGIDASISDKMEMAAVTFDSRKEEHDIQPEDNLGLLKDQTIGLVKLHHREVAPKLLPISTQESIVLKRDNYDLAGTIDIVEKDHRLADTKTSRIRYPDDAVQTKLQPALYATLYDEKYKTESQSFRFDVLVKNRLPIYQKVEAKVSKESKMLLHYTILSTIQELQIGLKTGIYRLAAPGHWRCQAKWCAYLNNGCPKGKK